MTTEKLSRHNSAETLKKALAAEVDRLGSVQALADLAKIAKQQMQRYVAGASTPGLDVLDRIAEAVGEAPANLIGGTSKSALVEALEEKIAEQKELARRQEERIRELEARASTLPPDIAQALAQAPADDAVWSALRAVLAARGILKAKKPVK